MYVTAIVCIQSFSTNAQSLPKQTTSPLKEKLNALIEVGLEAATFVRWPRSFNVIGRVRHGLGETSNIRPIDMSTYVC